MKIVWKKRQHTITKAEQRILLGALEARMEQLQESSENPQVARAGEQFEMTINGMWETYDLYRLLGGKERYEYFFPMKVH